MASKSRNFLKVAISILSLLPLTSGFHKIRQDAIYNNTAGTIEANLRLRQIQVVMRHGERTAPCYCPETDETVWKKEMTELSDEIPLPPYQFRNPATGEIVENPIDNENRRNGNKPKILKGGAIQFGLTRRGMEQCFKLGKAIRERYEDELPFDDKYFQENEIELFTSNFQRTKLSLAYVLAGVFPDYAQEPARKKNFTFNLLDGLLTRDHLKNSVTWKNWKRFCETYADDLVQGYQQSSEMIASLCKIKGKPPYWLLSGVTDLMVAWKANRLNEDQSQPKNEMASGLLDVLPDLEVKSHRLHQAKYIGDSRFGIDLKNLTAKPLLTKIISNMRRRTEGLTDKKMIFYSGHDVTLIPLLHAIGIPPETTLPLGASLTFELYQETSGMPWPLNILLDTIGLYYVRVVYQGRVVRWTDKFKWGYFQSELDDVTNPGVGLNGCKNAQFAMRVSNNVEDVTNPHCHNGKCIDVECPVR